MLSFHSKHSSFCPTAAVKPMSNDLVHAMQCSAVAIHAVQCSAFHAVQCSACHAVQCSAVQCSAVQCMPCCAVQCKPWQCMFFSLIDLYDYDLMILQIPNTKAVNVPGQLSPIISYMMLLQQLNFTLKKNTI
jgi:hypothetical protein